jgi:DNA-binding protein Fis
MIQELKQKKKTIPIIECIKGTQDMKRLQAELITVQTQKQEHWAQMEPLQEKVEEVLAQEEESKTQIAQTQEEFMELVSDEVAAQVVDTIKENTGQVQTQATKL